jgi:hypothetical protein
MTIFIADELAKNKLIDSDFRHATLETDAGFSWPLSSTGQIAKTDARCLVLGLYGRH